MSVTCGMGAEGSAIIGVLRWEKGPQDLSQFDSLPGHLLNPDTFSFPVRHERIRGACFHSVVEDPSEQVLQEMIRVGLRMERDGIQAISTSCGFNAIFQERLADALRVPVFASSLLQVPSVYRMLGKGSKVAVITADDRYLTPEHLRAVGIDDRVKVCIAGVQGTAEFAAMRNDPNAVLQVEKFRAETLDVVRRLVGGNPDVGAVVLECTDLPPFASDIRDFLGLPVFDIVSLTNWIHHGIAG